MGNEVTCPRCAGSLLRVNEPWCCRCGIPLVSAVDTCLRCRGEQEPGITTRAAFEYEQTVAAILTRFKIHGDRRIAVWLAKELAAVTDRHFPNAVLAPIPGSRKNVHRRGWDHMSEVLAVLSREGYTTIRPLVRGGGSAEQKSLARSERLSGAASSLRVRKRCLGAVHLSSARDVVIIDDVRTTGATLHAAANLLRSNAVNVVGAAVIAIR